MVKKLDLPLYMEAETLRVLRPVSIPRGSGLQLSTSILIFDMEHGELTSGPERQGWRISYSADLRTHALSGIDAFGLASGTVPCSADAGGVLIPYRALMLLDTPWLQNEFSSSL